MSGHDRHRHATSPIRSEAVVRRPEEERLEPDKQGRTEHDGTPGTVDGCAAANGHHSLAKRKADTSGAVWSNRAAQPVVEGFDTSCSCEHAYFVGFGELVSREVPWPNVRHGPAMREEEKNVRGRISKGEPFPFQENFPGQENRNRESDEASCHLRLSP